MNDTRVLYDESATVNLRKAINQYISHLSKLGYTLPEIQSMLELNANFALNEHHGKMIFRRVYGKDESIHE